MCRFFSAISDGKGKTLFFKIEDIVTQMTIGNPKSYDWNSHSSIADFHGLSATEEDQYNKWEYDVGDKQIDCDTMATTDDSIGADKEIKKYLKGKDIVFLRNLYDMNSGDRNSGYRNSAGLWRIRHF